MLIDCDVFYKFTDFDVAFLEGFNSFAVNYNIFKGHIFNHTLFIVAPYVRGVRVCAVIVNILKGNVFNFIAGAGVVSVFLHLQEEQTA